MPMGATLPAVFLPPPPQPIGAIITNKPPAVHSEINSKIVGDDDVRAFNFFLTGKEAPLNA